MAQDSISYTSWANNFLPQDQTAMGGGCFIRVQVSCEEGQTLAIHLKTVNIKKSLSSMNIVAGDKLGSCSLRHYPKFIRSTGYLIKDI